MIDNNDEFVDELVVLFCTNCPYRHDSCDNPRYELSNLYACIRDMWHMFGE